MIERNTVIPASRSKRIVTINDNQDSIDIRIFQGEARRASDNIELGAFTVRLPRAAAGKEGIECRFTYDVNGLLEVETTVESTGAKHRLVIAGNPGVLSPTEIEARLAALAHLKIKPRDEAENCAVLARAERVFEEFLGARREAVGDWISQFLAALETDDPKEAARARALLVQRLDGIEPESFF